MKNSNKLPYRQPTFYILPVNGIEGLQIDEHILNSNPDYSSDFILEYDNLGYITYCNPSACKKLGYTQGELINRHFTEFISKDHLKKVVSFFNSQYVQKIPKCYLEFKAATKNKTEFWISQKSILNFNKDWISGFKTVGISLAEKNKKVKEKNNLVEEGIEVYNTDFKSFSGSKILVVEDDKISQLVVSIFLEGWGLDFEIAESGIEAIKKVSENLYDLILMDIQLPEIDGFETSSYIRNHLLKPFSEIPIIVLTASHSSQVEEKCKASGINGFILKPFDPMELKKILLDIISTNKSSFNEMGDKSNNELIDLSYLYEISNGSNDFVKSIITVFIQQTPALIVALKEASDQLNWHEIGQIIHKAKATFYTMGIVTLEPVIESLEEMVEKKSDLNIILLQIEKLDKICNKVYYELNLKLALLNQLDNI